MLKVIEKEIGMSIRGFEWVGSFQKADKHHIVEFFGWSGEIYVRDKGILTNREYYKEMLEKGYCLYINGMIVAKTGYSAHYNVLYKEYLKQTMLLKTESKEKGYPVVKANEQVIFESAVQLYQQGILNLDQLRVRIERYIQSDKQHDVFQALTHIQAAS